MKYTNQGFTHFNEVNKAKVNTFTSHFIAITFIYNRQSKLINENNQLNYRNKKTIVN